MKRIVLVGAGHCHLLTMLALVKDSRFKREFTITLISNSNNQIYSGMLPGWLAGYYTFDQLSIDVEKLCKRLNIEFINAHISKIDAENQYVSVMDNTMAYDTLSFNVGSSTQHLNNQGAIPSKD